MAIKLGTSSVTLKLGTQSVTGYLGSAIVTATVPGAPTINFAGNDGFGGTIVQFFPPGSDGGSAITVYKVYFDGVEVSPDSVADDQASFSELSFAGQEAELSAVNAVGEGPKSNPFTVVGDP
jgi:hypothetical protein